MAITRPASLVQQGNLRLFATSLRVKDLRLPDFYKIETLDADEGVGYQRLLNESRARKLADYMLFLHLANQQDFKQETIVKLLKHGFDNLPSDHLGLAQPQFWYRGETASGLNQAALRKYAQALAAAINTKTNVGEIQL